MALHAVERAEIAAVRSVFQAGARSGIDAIVEDVRGVLCSACRGIPWDATANRALGLGVMHPAEEADIDAVLDFYRRQGTVCAIAVGPRVQPPDLGRRLEAQGFAAADAYAMLVTRSRPIHWRHPELRVERLPASGAEYFADVVLRAYDLPETLRGWVEAVGRQPGWTCYATYADAEPVGVGSLYAAGDVSWLAYGATLSHRRRRGSHGLLFDVRIDAAYGLGVETVAAATVLAAGGAPTTGYRNALRHGMELVYKGSDYVIDVVGS